MVKDLYVGTAGQYLHDINVCLTGIGHSREEWAKVCIDGCGRIATQCSYVTGRQEVSDSHIHTISIGREDDLVEG